jgi:hypothetical protein
MRMMLRGEDYASATLLEAIQRKHPTTQRPRRTVVFAVEGSEELRYLDAMQANANVGGADLTHIILRVDARRIEALEEFLHGTQYKCNLIEETLGLAKAEIHVKRYMIRHRRSLGISKRDRAILRAMLKGLSRGEAV